MSWNYRVGLKQVDGEFLHGFVEAHYDEKGNITGYTDFVEISAETKEGLAWIVDKLKEAVGKEVINIGGDVGVLKNDEVI